MELDVLCADTLKLFMNGFYPDVFGNSCVTSNCLASLEEIFNTFLTPSEAYAYYYYNPEHGELWGDPPASFFLKDYIHPSASFSNFEKFRCETHFEADLDILIENLTNFVLDNGWTIKLIREHILPKEDADGTIFFIYGMCVGQNNPSQGFSFIIKHGTLTSSDVSKIVETTGRFSRTEDSQNHHLFCMEIRMYENLE